MPADLGLEYAVRHRLIETREAFSLTALTLILKHELGPPLTMSQVRVVLEKLQRIGQVSSGRGLAHFAVRRNGQVELDTKKATLYFSTELPPEER